MHVANHFHAYWIRWDCQLTLDDINVNLRYVADDEYIGEEHCGGCLDAVFSWTKWFDFQSHKELDEPRKEAEKLGAY